MVKTAWVTDSTAFLDDELKNHPDLYTIPLTILLDGQEFADGIDLTAAQLFAKLKELKSPPKTSQPAVGVFQELYESLAKDYDQVVAVLLSGKLSGTVSSSEQAAKLVDIPVITFDSHILTAPMTALLKKGMELVEAGNSPESVIDQLESLKTTNETYVLIGSLEQLHRSGRMSGLQFFLGSMLNVKPIISIEDGALNTKEKVRSDKKAKEKILDYFKSSYEKHKFKEVYILYGLHLEHANEWKVELERQYPELKVICCPLGRCYWCPCRRKHTWISWHNGLK